MNKIYISIPTPCHEDWDGMTPAEKGRFCGSCQKTVIDFTNMSDRELVAYFTKPAESMCGRFHPDQLNREVAIPRKRIPWLKYFFTVTWPALMFFLKSCNFKDRIPVKSIANHSLLSNKKQDNIIVGELDVDIPPVGGQIRIADGEASKTKVVKEGIIAESLTGDVMVKIDSIVVEEDTTFLEANIKQSDTAVTEEIAKQLTGIAGGIVIRRANPEPLIPLIPSTVNTMQVSKPFTAYPNPITAGKTLSIRFTNDQDSPVKVHVFSAAGQTIAIKQLADNVPSSTSGLFIPANTSTGIYYIQVLYKSGHVEKSSVMITR